MTLCCRGVRGAITVDRNEAQTILSAIEEASWCSSDPLCIESQGLHPFPGNFYQV